MIMRLKSVSLSPLSRAILATVAYTDQFDHPLTLQEIKDRCLFVSKPTKEGFDATIKKLMQQRLIEQVRSTQTRQTFFCLKDRSHIIQKRQKRLEYAGQKRKELGPILRFFLSISWIKAVYLTGSQAMNSAEPNSDVDFMIITQPKRLWMTRILVSLFAQLQGKRRSWNHEEPGSWCFNLWLDTEHLTVVKEKQDTYRAYEVYQAHQLLAGRENRSLFWNANMWINSFFWSPKLPLKKRSSAQVSSQSKHFFSPVVDFLDWSAWRFQVWYMSRHRTTEKVGRGFAFFHPRDTAGFIYTGWLKSLESCLPKSQALEILQPYVRRTAS